MTWCLPCVQVGNNFSDPKNEEFSWLMCIISVLPCGLFYTSWVSRVRVQETYNIDETSGHRILLVLCCTPCIICQDAREIKRQKMGAPAATPATA